MTIKEEKLCNLYERKGYLMYLLEEIGNNHSEEGLADEVESVVNEIIEISIDIYCDFPDCLEELQY